MKLAEEIRAIPQDEKALRRFGLTLGAFFASLTFWNLWKQGEPAPIFGTLTAFFGVTGWLCPKVLKSVQKIWMTAALLMGWIMTRILLSLFFYGVMTPVGFLMRVSGKKFSEKALTGENHTWWLNRDIKEKDRSSYENQY